VVRCWKRLPREVVNAPTPGGVQGQVGWGPGQPAVIGGSPAHGSGVRTEQALRSLSAQTIQ